MSLPLLALALSSFCIGLTEFVVIGILPILADYFQISIAEAGNLVTYYALAVVAGAPLGAGLTSRMPRKTLIVILMVLFAFGNLLAAIASDHSTLIWGRIFSGIAHGVFFAVSTNIAVQLVSKEKQGSAIALMFSGLTVALVAGVPLGTFLAASFSWRSTFWVVTVCAILALLSILLFIPNGIHHVKPKSLIKQFEVLFHGKILATYGMTILSFGGPFIAYTYLAAILQQITGFSLYWIGPLLVIFGIAVALGNIWGGKWTDAKGSIPTLKVSIFCLIAILIAFYFGQHLKWIVIPLLFLWGVASYAVVPALQLLVVSIVKHCNLQSADVAAGANIAAFNIGIASASYLGSFIVAKAGLEATSLASALAAAATFVYILCMGKFVARAGQ